MTTTMATYGRTLCWTKRNTTPKTGRVFAVGQVNSLWTLPTWRGEEVRPWVSSELAPGHPVSLLSRQLLPIVVLVLYPPIRDAVVVHLAREGPTARFLHGGGTYWKQSKYIFTGEGL